MCMDNLSGFTEAIQDSFPYTILQKCIVDQVRNSLRYVDGSDRKEILKDLRIIYTSVTEEQAKSGLISFESKWGNKYK